MVLPKFAWMNVYEHRLSTLILPGQGELWNKEHSEPRLFRPSQPGKGQHEDLMLPLSGHCHQWREYAPLWGSLPWPDPALLSYPGKFRKNRFDYAFLKNFSLLSRSSASASSSFCMSSIFW